MKTSPVASSSLLIALLALAQGLSVTFLAHADATNCVTPPPGLASWWPGNGTAEDIADGNPGILIGNTAYAAGKVGSAFVFDGNQDGVLIGNAVNLQLQNFSIEAWVKRASSSVLSFNGNGGAQLFVLGAAGGGFAFYLDTGGLLTLGKLQVSAVSSTAQITDTNWHHVAVTKLGTTVVFYVDGVAYLAPAYNSGGFSFTGPGYIGAWLNPSAQLDNSFYGLIDELAVYNRALSAPEIQSIYDAGSFGKCGGPAPVIILQPTNKTVFVSESPVFTVTALGTPPLSYQWSFKGTNVAGATNASLTVANAQSTNAGSYAVVVTNVFGTATSSNAVLTVNPIPPCSSSSTGLISWWRGEGNANDTVTGNQGVLAGNANYGAGRAGQGFVFDGIADGVQLGNPANLRLQNLTIEAWIKRSSASVSSLTINEGALFAFGPGGYGFSIFDNGNLSLTRVNVDNVISGTTITDTDWHHVAVTRTNSTVLFYVDGVAYAVAAYNPTFTFTSNAAIGGRGDNLSYSFYGSIDELAVYNRVLSGTEIQAIYNAGLSGKCNVPAAPVIVAHPQNTNAIAGTNMTFAVVAGGSAMLRYQWRFNGTNIASATNAAFTLTNVQFSHIGSYSVQITNVAGTVVSSNASLAVTFPTPVVRAVNTNAMAGAPVTVPVTIVANGNENTFGFTLTFNTQRLAFASATPGSGVAGATMLVNTSQIATGRLGLAFTFPPQLTFAAGTQEVVKINFNSLPLLGASPANATNIFSDQPVPRELYDAQLQALTANYSNGIVTLAPTVFEADVFPRTNGNQAVTATDLAQAGRFAARLDAVATTNEFQRADIAPRATLGDGQMKVTDWVQAGRYLAGLDPLAAIGGPISEAAPTLAGASATRQLRVVNANIPQGQAVTVAVNLEAQGVENAVGFTFAFDTSAFTFVGVAPGSAALGANFTPNTSQAGAGRLGVVLALPTGSAFSPGTKQLALINLLATPTATGIFAATLTDQLVTRCVSDAQAGELPVTYFNGNITINSTNPPPSLAIARASNNVVVSWPAWAGDYALQWADSTDGLPGAWTNTPGPLQTNGGNILSTLPLTNQTKLFRLRR